MDWLIEDAVMELYHTSGAEITNINELGRFGSHLCFADEPYFMAIDPAITYKIEIDENDIIEAGSIFYHDDAEKLSALASEVAERIGCSEDDAEEVISQRLNVWDMDLELEADELAELSWDSQRWAAEAAALLGYRGVSMQDEQGTMYLVDMLSRESDLVAVKDETTV